MRVLKNIIKYTIGLPYLLLASLINIIDFIFDIFENIVIKGKYIFVLEWCVTKDMLKEIWETIK